MAVKQYDLLSVEDIDAMLEANASSVSRLKKRMRDTIRSRMQVFEKRGLKDTEGYRKLEQAMRLSLGKTTSFKVSYLSYVLGSKSASYTGYIEARKKAVESINLEFGTWEVNPKTGRQELVKSFLQSDSDVSDFFDLLHWMKDNVEGFAYRKKQKEALENMYQTMKSRGETWKETRLFLEGMKERYYDAGEEPDIDAIINTYLKG